MTLISRATGALMLTLAASAPAGRLWFRTFRRTDPQCACCVLHLRRLHGYPAMSDSDPVVLPSAMRHPQLSAHDLDDSERTRYTTCAEWAARSPCTEWALPCSAVGREHGGERSPHDKDAKPECQHGEHPVDQQPSLPGGDHARPQGIHSFTVRGEPCLRLQPSVSSHKVTYF